MYNIDHMYTYMYIYLYIWLIGICAIIQANIIIKFFHNNLYVTEQAKKGQM